MLHLRKLEEVDLPSESVAVFCLGSFFANEDSERSLLGLTSQLRNATWGLKTGETLPWQHALGGQVQVCVVLSQREVQVVDLVIQVQARQLFLVEQGSQCWTWQWPMILAEQPVSC